MGLGLPDATRSGWDAMNEIADSESVEQNRRVKAVKYLALALCLALFVIYGLLVG